MHAYASILLHKTQAGPHLDLLIGGALCRTWSFYPTKRLLHLNQGACFFRCQENHLHRRFYLDYSGPVSGDRGWVHCLWRGRIWHQQHSSVSLAQTWKTDAFEIHATATGLARLMHGDRLAPWLKSNF